MLDDAHFCVKGLAMELAIKSAENKGWETSVQEGGEWRLSLYQRPLLAV